MGKSITKRAKRAKAKIKHVLQLGPPEKDCSIACVAMIANAPYYHAWLVVKSKAPYVERWGAPTAKTIEALEEFTGRKWHFQRLPKPHPLLADAPWPFVPCCAVIREDGQAKGHMVVWDGERMIHDPSWFQGIVLKSYARDFVKAGIVMRAVGFITPLDSPANKGA
jgi:hypothetical protein